MFEWIEGRTRTSAREGPAPPPGEGVAATGRFVLAPGEACASQVNFQITTGTPAVGLGEECKIHGLRPKRRKICEPNEMNC